jgi:hypothetical protein
MRFLLVIALTPLLVMPASHHAGIARTPISPIAPAIAQAPDIDPEKVNVAIDKAISYLRSKQKNGSWEHVGISSFPGGVTCLAMLALLEAGVDPSDRSIQGGLRVVRKLEPADTYVVALQIMVLAKATPKDDLVQMKRLVEWLKAKAVREKEKDGSERLMGWGYSNPNKQATRGADNSNTQYAVLALWFASQAGIPIESRLWKEIRAMYIAGQQKSGGWSYWPEKRGNRFDDERLTMTAAGICGLLIADMELAKDPAERGDNRNRGCGPEVGNLPLENALKNFGRNFAIDSANTSWRYYHLYGVERTGRLSGLRFFAGEGDVLSTGKDWYRAGVRFLLDTVPPRGEGWWGRDGNHDSQEIVATSFCLLFLSKGRTPVLIHKLATGLPATRRAYTGEPGGNWNIARNDVRNLTEFCSQNVFKKGSRPVPLTWQIFDAGRQALDDRLVQDLLQAPIVYFNGTRAPEFTRQEELLLQRYVDQGGFIVAEALRGQSEFTEGFRALAKKLWPDRSLTPLDEGHAVWTAAFHLPPNRFKLEGIDFGCKLGVVLVNDDLACHWESNLHTGLKTDKSVQAFQMGANLVAYATGLEPPDYKGVRKTLTSDREDPTIRNYLQIAQINYGGPDWQPARYAMRNVLEHVGKNHGVDVIVQTKPIMLGDASLPNYKVLYMHGRREFTIQPEDQKRLRQHLETGGFLLADACCGAEAFDRKFEELISTMFGRKLVDVPVDDPLYSARFGTELKRVMCRTQRGAAYQSMAPQLRGLRLDPANPLSPWIVIYSKYDLGCALDKHQSTSCLGHNYESALAIATQAVLYSLRE